MHDMNVASLPYEDVIADIHYTAESMAQLLGTHLAAWKIADQKTRLIKASASMIGGWGIRCAVDAHKQHGKRQIRLEVCLTFHPLGIESYGEAPSVSRFMMGPHQLGPDTRDGIRDFIDTSINSWFQKATVAHEARQSQKSS